MLMTARNVKQISNLSGNVITHVKAIFRSLWIIQRAAVGKHLGKIYLLQLFHFDNSYP